MPNCFQLISRKTKEATKFSVIDEEICVLLGQPVDPIKYIAGWYDFFGWKVAVSGLKLDSPEMIEAVTKITKDPLPDMAKYGHVLEKIRSFLHENYTTDAWVEIGRR